VLNDDTIAAVQGMQQDRRLARSRMAIQSGGIQAAISYLGANETPQVLIVEASETGQALFQRIEALAEVCDPSSAVVLVGQENDIALYRELKNLGLAEYFCGDVSTEKLMATILGSYSEETQSTLSRVLSFVGARGGVGSSVLAANVARRIGQEFKEDVLLMDCDMAFGTAALSCNVDPKQSIADILAQPERLDETLVERVKLKVDDYLSLIPAPSTLTGDYDIAPESFEALMRLARSMAPYVVLDLPHMWSPWIQDVLIDSSEMVVVTTPDLAGMRDSKNLSEAIAGRSAADGVKLVLNKVGMSRKTEISAKDFEAQINLAPVASVPFEPILFGEAMNNGEFLDKTAKNNKAVAEITKLSQMLSGSDPLSKNEAKAKQKKVKAQRKSAFSALKFAR